MDKLLGTMLMATVAVGVFSSSALAAERDAVAVDAVGVAEAKAEKSVKAAADTATGEDLTAVVEKEIGDVKPSAWALRRVFMRRTWTSKFRPIPFIITTVKWA